VHIEAVVAAGKGGMASDAPDDQIVLPLHSGTRLTE